ncbi:hypothetical protein FRC00_006041 [Tulasnella sp. 408]|nr:hypothetical protein FRC00_006041 [Tulasnella sp. 408]
MAISGNQLAQILKSFGASPEDIAAAAAELSRSVAPATVASTEPLAAPSSQVVTPAMPCDPSPYVADPAQASSTASQPVIATQVAPSPTHSAAPLCLTPTTSTALPFPTLSTSAALQPTQASTPSPTTLVSCVPGVSVPASGAAEYFQIKSGAPSMQSVPSSAMHGLHQLALSSAANGASIGSAMPSASSTAPSWDIPAPRVSQWGASGTSAAPQPAVLPRAMGSALVTASTGSSPAAQAFSWITSSTPVPKASRRKPSSSVSKAASRKPVSRKTVYLIPRANASQLTPKIKAACDFAGLIASPELWSDMSSAEVREALQEPFKSIIDFTAHSYQLFHITRGLGPTLCRAQPAFPSGTDLRALYQKKQVLIMRLMFSADVPEFDEGLRLYERARGGGEEDEEDEADEDEDDNDDEGELVFVCSLCNGTFDLDKYEVHQSKCPAHRKRKLSSKSSHSRHQSVPTILSPERKRARAGQPREASSDGEADYCAPEGRLSSFEEEELDEIDADSEADQDEDTGDAATNTRAVGGYTLRPVVNPVKL